MSDMDTNKQKNKKVAINIATFVVILVDRGTCLRFSFTKTYHLLHFIVVHYCFRLLLVCSLRSTSPYGNSSEPDDKNNLQYKNNAINIIRLLNEYMED